MSDFDLLNSNLKSLNSIDSVDSVELAKIFHETYERLASEYGYETREETKIFDPESPNGKLMLAVCREVKEIINNYLTGEEKK